MFLRFAFLLLFVLYVSAEEGDPCTTNSGAAGTCKDIRNCKSAVEELKKKQSPKICSFLGTIPVVCCMDGGAPKPTPAPTPAPTPRPVTKRPQPSSTEGIPEEDEECEPLSNELTSPKTGRKAWDKCVEYQEALVYPCKRAVSVLGGKSRQYLCHHNADDLIVGGEDAALNEFTHMILLGYGTDEASILWNCGGSLISESWVLTAAHCTYNRNYGEVTFLRAGALRRSDPVGDMLRKVDHYVNAPGYTSATQYNDIALVKMDRPVSLDQFLVPACIHVGDQVEEGRVLAAGWGLTEYRGNVSDVLQKVILKKFPADECSTFFPPGNRHMLWGVEDSTQICYGDKEKSKDTCQGDSGSPIMIKSKKLHCMYVVTGVTSFGKRCGRIGDPAIYTRVAHFVDWIEKTVWP